MQFFAIKNLISVFVVGALLTYCAPPALAGNGTGTGIVNMQVIIDGSSSISLEDFGVFIGGGADSVRKVKTDGSVKFGVTHFWTFSEEIVEPVLIDSEATRESIAAAVEAMVPDSLGGTNYEEAFEKAVEDATTGSSVFDPDDLNFINMLSDGKPTVSNFIIANPLQFFSTSSEEVNARAEMDGKTARDGALAAGFDVISFEAIDFDPAGLRYLLELAAPQPSVVAPAFPDPIDSAGFVVEVSDFAGVESALTEKFAAAGLIPEPASLLMVVLGGVTLFSHRHQNNQHEPHCAVSENAIRTVETARTLVRRVRVIGGSTMKVGCLMLDTDAGCWRLDDRCCIPC